MALVKIKGSFALLFAGSCDHHKFAVLFPHLAVVCFQGCQFTGPAMSELQHSL
jgi:hypothetical protein